MLLCAYQHTRMRQSELCNVKFLYISIYFLYVHYARLRGEVLGAKAIRMPTSNES